MRHPDIARLVTLHGWLGQYFSLIGVAGAAISEPLLWKTSVRPAFKGSRVFWYVL
jgi:hypothetical protein